MPQHYPTTNRRRMVARRRVKDTSTVGRMHPPLLVAKAAEEMTGAMVALWIGDDARFPAKPEQRGILHVTLAYLGKADDLGEKRQTILDVVTVTAASHEPLVGVASGITAWPTPSGRCVSVPVDIGGLGSFRAHLVEDLARAGVEVAANHDFNAHLTLGEPFEGPLPAMVGPVPLRFEQVATVLGPERLFARLGILKDGVKSGGGGKPQHYDAKGRYGTGYTGSGFDRPVTVEDGRTVIGRGRTMRSNEFGLPEGGEWTDENPHLRSAVARFSEVLPGVALVINPSQRKVANLPNHIQMLAEAAQEMVSTYPMIHSTLGRVIVGSPAEAGGRDNWVGMHSPMADHSQVIEHPETWRPPKAIIHVDVRAQQQQADYNRKVHTVGSSSTREGQAALEADYARRVAEGTVKPYEENLPGWDPPGKPPNLWTIDDVLPRGPMRTYGTMLHEMGHNVDWGVRMHDIVDETRLQHTNAAAEGRKYMAAHGGEKPKYTSDPEEHERMAAEAAPGLQAARTASFEAVNNQRKSLEPYRLLPTEEARASYIWPFKAERIEDYGRTVNDTGLAAMERGKAIQRAITFTTRGEGKGPSQYGATMGVEAVTEILSAHHLGYPLNKDQQVLVDYLHERAQQPIEWDLAPDGRTGGDRWVIKADEDPPPIMDGPEMIDDGVVGWWIAKVTGAAA